MYIIYDICVTEYKARMLKRKILEEAVQTYKNRVRKCRLEARVATQEDLARMTCIGRTTISALENNRLFLSSPYALRIAEVLGCKLDDLFCEKDEPIPLKANHMSPKGAHNEKKGGRKRKTKNPKGKEYI